MPRRTAEIIARSAARVEGARRAGQSKAAVRSLAQKESVKGYSLLFAASPEDRARYPALEYLWRLRPKLLPYDTMHIFLSNVFARQSELFAGENEQLGEDQRCAIPKSIRKAIGREIKAGRRTVPLGSLTIASPVQIRTGFLTPGRGT